MTSTSTTLEVPGATLAYDVHGPLPTPDGPRPLLVIGQPMTAEGFGTLASLVPDRPVITYDPRGLGRSVRHDGGSEHRPEQQADDLHRLVEHLGVGPVDLFGSSGGAVAGLALVAAHPGDLVTFVAHEPPVMALLPDADAALAASALVTRIYHERGWGAGMAAFIAMTSIEGEVPADFGRELPGPEVFGLPTEDDGQRDDPLLSGTSAPVSAFRPDVAALRAAPTRVVLAVGEKTGDTVTGRTTAALAEALGVGLTSFPGDHGGFLGGEYGQVGEPEAFAARLREVLAEHG
ncbi:alpha/beta fold hydrolase [Actinotalea fermentans]|uniref:Hydrolase n=1 Tax=Actinotalea fermentans TaxID=43671 RepID=A0A511YWD6_9CELL|nr:alpha/beta hydrolase [Actinotalea fermentans]KGM17514.1 hydrolase [Actinotalea fermentans ATCC 43279 = JCM 9966 = DSM 3133]GEN79508.1 hydrolase [Actinotalea fermentans]